MTGFEEAAAIAALTATAAEGAGAATAAALPAAGMAATGAGTGGMLAATAMPATLGSQMLAGSTMPWIGAGMATDAAGSAGMGLGADRAAANAFDPMVGGLLGAPTAPTPTGLAAPSFMSKLGSSMGAVAKGMPAANAAMHIMQPQQVSGSAPRQQQAQFQPSAPPVGTPAAVPPGLLGSKLTPQQIELLLRKQRGY